MDKLHYRNVEENAKYVLQHMVEAQLPSLKMYKPHAPRATWALEVEKHKEKWRGTTFQYLYKEIKRIAKGINARVTHSQIIGKAIDIAEEFHIPYEAELRYILLEVPIIRAFEPHLQWMESIGCTGKFLYYFFVFNGKFLKVLHLLLTISQTK